MPASLFEPMVYLIDLVIELTLYIFPWYSPKVILIDAKGIHLKLFLGPRLIRWAPVFKIESYPGARPEQCKVTVSIKNADPETFRYMGTEASLQKELENTMPEYIEFIPYENKNAIASR